MSDESACYGRMYPNLATMEYQQDMIGKVFTVRFESSGLWKQNRVIEINRQAWQACQACPVYRECYDLSIAELHLSLVVRQLT